MLDGLPLIVGWAAGGLLFAAIARTASAGLEQRLLLAGIGGHLLLALSHAVVAAPPQMLAGGPVRFAGLAGLALVAAASMVSARLAADGEPELRAVLEVTALAVLGYQTAIALDGLALTAALAAEAVALALIARRSPSDEVALGGAVAFSGATLLHALAVLAPPAALVSGLDAPVEALAGLALAAVAVAAAGLAAPRWAGAARAATAVVVLHAVSVELVTPFRTRRASRSSSSTSASRARRCSARCGGSSASRCSWPASCVTTCCCAAAPSCCSPSPSPRVFVFDLASLTSLYRAAPFVALGLLLLAGAFAWQRIRPQPLPDLRAVHGPLR